MQKKSDHVLFSANEPNATMLVIHRNATCVALAAMLEFSLNLCSSTQKNVAFPVCRKIGATYAETE